jgi:tetratricopeptide (TPR) repeat protein
MFLLQYYTILACLLIVIWHSFATKHIESNRKPTDVTITANTTAESTELEYAKLCDINIFLGVDALNDALEMLNQGLTINEKVHGKEHLATAVCYNNIGAVMKAMGDNFHALEMLNRGLATFDKVYGKEHPATATAYTNIGSVMEAMGINVEALEMYNQGLAIREKVLGLEHPDTVESYNNIELLMQAMGNNVGAREMLKQGLVIDEEVYTPVSSHLQVRRS